MPKYTGREIVINEDDNYKDLFEIRGVQNIEQYKTFFFNRDYFRYSYGSYEHVWKKGDKLFKLAQEYYEDIKYWWIIAVWNGKPTDSHYKYGDVIEIPYPAMEIYRELMG